MTSSPNKTTPPPDRPGDPLLVAEGGVRYAVLPGGDPIEAWLDLMEVVEALCPEPPAPAPKVWCDYRL